MDIMEAASEKKRGRPPKIAGEERAALKKHFPNHTDRRRADFFYAGMAHRELEGLYFGVVAEDPSLAKRLRERTGWVLEKPSILAELGRILGPEEEPGEEEAMLFLYAVRWLEDSYPNRNVKRAVAHIRRMRLGETRRGHRLAALHHDLNQAINRHRQRYPETDWEDVLGALDYTVRQVARKTNPQAASKKQGE
jgi:hypothetical protein